MVFYHLQWPATLVMTGRWIPRWNLSMAPVQLLQGHELRGRRLVEILLLFLELLTVFDKMDGGIRGINGIFWCEYLCSKLSIWFDLIKISSNLIYSNLIYSHLESSTLSLSLCLCKVGLETDQMSSLVFTLYLPMLASPGAWTMELSQESCSVTCLNKSSRLNLFSS